MTNLLSKTNGRTLLNGVDTAHDPKQALADVGAVVETPEFYPFLTPVETLEYLGRLRGMSKDHLKVRIDEVLRLVKMEENKDKRIGEFSKGMKQRVAIAQAALHEPSVIILDEPTSGLDPLGMFEVREVLRGVEEGGLYHLHELPPSERGAGGLHRHRLDQPWQAAALRQGERPSPRGPSEEYRGQGHQSPGWEHPGQDRGCERGQGAAGHQRQHVLLNLEGDDEVQARMLLDLQALGLRIVYFRESGLALESLYRSLITDSR